MGNGNMLLPPSMGRPRACCGPAGKGVEQLKDELIAAKLQVSHLHDREVRIAWHEQLPCATWRSTRSVVASAMHKGTHVHACHAMHTPGGMIRLRTQCSVSRTQCSVRQYKQTLACTLFTSAELHVLTPYMCACMCAQRVLQAQKNRAEGELSSARTTLLKAEE